MKNNFKIITSLLIVLIIQISVVNQLVYEIFPINLMLIYTIYKTERVGYEDSYLSIIILGLMYDGVLSSNFGIQALILYIVAIVVGVIREYLFLDTYKVDIFYGFIGVTIYTSLSLMLAYLYNLPIAISLKDFLIKVVINSIVLIIIRRVEKRRKLLDIKV